MSHRTPDARAGVAASVDEYLARLGGPERRALAALRARIRAAAPNAAETISYQIPTYRLHGPLVHFAAQPRHLSFTIVSLEVVNAFRGELETFDLCGRTVRFTAAKPLPAGLVQRIVRARVRENEARATRLAPSRSRSGAAARTASPRRRPAARASR